MKISPLMRHPLVARAARFAEERHEGQVRKYTGMPYSTHLERVAALTAMACPVPCVVAAAWLHDVVEDTPVTVADLESEFSTAVAWIVRSLTDTGAGRNRAERKAADRARLAAAGAAVQTIKLADLIDNTMSIAVWDPGFARTYLEEKRLLLPLLTRGPGVLRSLAETLLATAQEHVMDTVVADRHGWRTFPPAWPQEETAQAVDIEPGDYVAAIRWAGNNVSEILDFGTSGPQPLWGADFQVDHHDQTVRFLTRGGPTEAFVGDWIVRDQNGIFSVFSGGFTFRPS